MDVGDEYRSSLNDLNFNSKPLINMLTMLADENKKHSVIIVKTIVNHINSAPPDSKLPGMYLVDSIIKNLGDIYLKIFCDVIVDLFASTFEKVDENTRSSLFKLRQTWSGVIPNAMLYRLDESVKKIDPAWPITAKSSSKRILVNPRFLDGSKASSADGAATASSAGVVNAAGDRVAPVTGSKVVATHTDLTACSKSMKASSGGSTTVSCNRAPLVASKSSSSRCVPDNGSVTGKVEEKKGGTAAEANLKAEEIEIKQRQGEVLKELLVKQQQLKQMELRKLQQSMKRQSIGASNSAKSSFRDPRMIKINHPSKTSWKISKQEKPSSLDKSNLSNKSAVELNSNTKGNANNSTGLKKSIQDVEKELVSQRNSKAASSGGLSIPKTSKKEENQQFKEVPSQESLKWYSKPIPKKNSFASDHNKVSQQSSNSSKKNSKSCFDKDMKTFRKSDKPISEDRNVSKQATSTVNKWDKINRTDLNIDKSVDKKTLTKTIDSLAKIDDPHECAKKDPNTSVIKEEAFKKLAKRDLDLEVDKGYQPQKKIKADDIENCNPDFRTKSPILFGQQDQDSRSFLSDSKDWSQYKEVHPDEYSPSRPTEYPGKLKFQRNKFAPYPLEHERNYSYFKPSRGRYVSRRNARRMRYPRSFWGRRPSGSSVHRIMFNSDAVLRQAEEKYHDGRLSEREYHDIRHGLQKMVENQDHLFTPHQQKWNTAHYKLRPNAYSHQFEGDDRRDYPENIKIQEPSRNPPAIKPFILDGKERLIHFLEDKALVLLDNEEPRRLTFENEPRNVYIEGMKSPLTLGFDGKLVEFEIDGRRHILRLGIPGRELFIDNYPYEAQFGGPPIIARLEDGHEFKIRLSGPPPTVVIGENSEFELFAKYCGKRPSKQEIDNANVEMESNPRSLQDVDMRMKPVTISHSNVLLNEDSPFFSEDMKDVDWRYLPPSANLEAHETPPDQREFEAWPEDYSNKDRRKQNEPLQNPVSNQWVEDPALVHPVPTPSSAGNWHYKEQWQYADYGQSGNFAHPQKQFMNKLPSNAKEEFEPNLSGSRSNSYAYLKRPSPQDNQYGNQSHSSAFVPRHSAPFPIIPVKPKIGLLPPPPFPPDCFANMDIRDLSHSTDNIKPSGILEEQKNDFPFPANSVESVIGPESSTSDFEIDVQSLLQKLVTAGLINTTVQEQLSVEKPMDTTVSESVDEKELPEIVPQIVFTSEALKVHHPTIISDLHKGVQCAACGMRFKEKNSEQYSSHLDWHFRMNRREKDSVKKAISRRWYYEIEDWIQFEEFADVEERVPSYFELEADNQQAQTVEVPVVVSVPATNDDQESCPVCQEKFQLFWVEDEEEWHYRDAVRHDSVTYHPACYEDFKKTSAKHAELADVDEGSSDVLEDVTILWNSLVSQVEQQLEGEWEERDVKVGEEEMMDGISESNDACQFEKPMEAKCEEEIVEGQPGEQKIVGVLSETNDVTVPCEVEKGENVCEEEILEGKPGEEEIIGVISDTDFEMDCDVPKRDSKMVVMQSGGITLKVKAESLHCHSPSSGDREGKQWNEERGTDDEVQFCPPTPDPRFEERPLVSRGRELSGLCCIM